MKKLCYGALIALSAVLSFSCGSSKTAAEAGKTETAYEADPSEAVSIALPERKNRSYFSSIPEQVVANVEIGSPDTLKTAINQLKKSPDTITEAEKVLLSVAIQVLQIVWQTESIPAALPEISGTNPYLGAIETARQGVYDSSTGKTDFLTKVLPSLVLITSEIRNDYYGQAKSDLQSALKDRNDSVLAQYLMGVLCRRSGDYKGAVKAFDQAHQIAPGCFEAAYALAQSKLLTGDAKGAESDAKALLQGYGNNRELLKLAAEAAYNAGDMDEAEQYVARVLQQESENTYYILFRAKILVKKGDYIKAASLLDVYARSDTVSRDYLVLRAKVQKDWNRNNAAALSTIEQALKLYPDDTEIVLVAAELSSQTGAKVGGKTASELAAEILKKDPKNVSALQIQVVEMQQAHNYTGAYRASSTLMSLPSAPADAVYSHINICLMSNHKDEAWDLASRLYSEQPGDEAVVQSYIHVLVSTGRNQEASRIISQQLSSANARMKSFLFYERSFLETTEDAILGDLRSSLTSNPRNKDALMRLYQVYYYKREYRKAQYYLKQVVALSPGDENLLVLNRDLDTLLAR